MTSNWHHIQRVFLALDAPRPQAPKKQRKNASRAGRPMEAASKRAASPATHAPSSLPPQTGSQCIPFPLVSILLTAKSKTGSTLRYIRSKKGST
ncbi:hypothetical protein NDU88_004749 [Pleurodeles waltl]|uniref:Uncharacterized protein n=1 Tax=Pleurodeles waltl TaxID=8319 RepID=A0AAV7TS55_PLEWA|nr:hypothetical protein NDU88_004749 [Pleurodeles waltl]